MTLLYHLIVETRAREIEYSYDKTRDALHAWAFVLNEQRAPDDSGDAVTASLWRNGLLIRRWRRSAEIIPFRAA